MGISWSSRASTLNPSLNIEIASKESQKKQNEDMITLDSKEKNHESIKESKNSNTSKEVNKVPLSVASSQAIRPPESLTFKDLTERFSSVISKWGTEDEPISSAVNRSIACGLVGAGIGGILAAFRDAPTTAYMARLGAVYLLTGFVYFGKLLQLIISLFFFSASTWFHIIYLNSTIFRNIRSS